MKITMTTILFVLALTGYSYADALWYSLDGGSMVHFNNGESVSLTGRIALAECDGKRAKTKDDRRLLPIHAVAIDNLPSELEPHITDANKQISLFGGHGGVAVSPKPVFIATSAGKANSFEWVLQQQLEQDSGNEASVFTRMLQLDTNQNSSITQQAEDQSCPDRIELHLVALDIRRTYTPRISNLATGEQHRETITTSATIETFGHVSIFANVIPNSEEKIDDVMTKRMKLADKVKIRPTKVPPRPFQKPLGTPMPPESYGISPAQPSATSNQ